MNPFTEILFILRSVQEMTISPEMADYLLYAAPDREKYLPSLVFSKYDPHFDGITVKLAPLMRFILSLSQEDFSQ